MTSSLLRNTASVGQRAAAFIDIASKHSSALCWYGLAVGCCCCTTFTGKDQRTCPHLIDDCLRLWVSNDPHSDLVQRGAQLGTREMQASMIVFRVFPVRFLQWSVFGSESWLFTSGLPDSQSNTPWKNMKLARFPPVFTAATWEHFADGISSALVIAAGGAENSEERWRVWVDDLLRRACVVFVESVAWLDDPCSKSGSVFATRASQ